MAFERVVVKRSPVLVWFGVLATIAWFAMMRSGTARTFDRLFEYLVAGHSGAWFLLGGYVLFAYCVFRGLYGAWWGELWVDREARRIKASTGTVVDVGRIGAVSVKDHRELVADNVDGPLYIGTFEAVEARRQALEHILRSRGRLQLFRLRRLAYHRSTVLFGAAFVACFALTVVVLDNIVYSNVHEIEYKALAAGGYLVCIASAIYALFGSFSPDQLYVDPIAGVLRLDNGAIKRFDELGELSINERNDLRAANVGVIFTTEWGRPRAQRRLDALSTALLQHELRRALEAPLVDHDAFRSGMDPKQEVERIAGDSPYRGAALTALARDPDPMIRERATALL